MYLSKICCVLIHLNFFFWFIYERERKRQKKRSPICSLIFLSVHNSQDCIRSKLGSWNSVSFLRVSGNQLVESSRLPPKLCILQECGNRNWDQVWKPDTLKWSNIPSTSQLLGQACTLSFQIEIQYPNLSHLNSIEIIP